MKRMLLFTCVLALCGCGRREEKAEANTEPSPASTAIQHLDGMVIIPPDSPKLKQIAVAPVKSEEIPLDEVDSPGKIEVNPNRVSRIVLPVTGRVTKVLVRLGDAVRKGQTLLTLDSPDADVANSAYLQAQAGVNQSKANLMKAQADHDRASDLYEHNAVAKKEVLNAENALAQAKAAMEGAQATLEQSIRRLNLLGLKPGAFGEEVVVSAPLSGKVLELSVAAGEYRNDTNSAVMTIADLSTVWVSSDVPESSIRLIHVGERIDVTLAAYPGQVFRGRVTRIADTVDPQTRTVKVRAEMENGGERFRPEMFGSIRHTEGSRMVPVVPVGAVIQGDGRNVVFVEQAPGRFRQTVVLTGQRYQDVLPIEKGLKPGDRVVVDGVMLLRAQ